MSGGYFRRIVSPGRFAFEELWLFSSDSAENFRE